MNNYLPYRVVILDSKIREHLKSITMQLSKIIVITVIAVGIIACNKPTSQVSSKSSSTDRQETEAVTDEPSSPGTIKTFTISDEIKLSSVTKSDEDWKNQLNDMEYYVIREKGTERAFTGEYWDNKAEGIYVCRACDLPLYDSKTKFKSGTGWPSYWEAIDKDYILEDTDYILGYARTELMCGRCEGHLGHVFTDGPEPTGERHCINSASLQFIPQSDVDAFIVNLKDQK